MTNYHRQILALTDAELERFVRDWVAQKTARYVEVTTFSGPGDLGRDVVGFLSADRHEGEWHNYQCKQYGRTIPTAEAFGEIAKVLYHASTGAFTAPAKYILVAPRGVNRNLEKLIYNPSSFKTQIIADWENSCANGIVADTHIGLTDALEQTVLAFDFSRISRVRLDDILGDVDITPVLHRWFGADPGPPPLGSVPPDVQIEELPYIAQLVDAYGEREGCTYESHAAAAGHAQHGPHLARQRERFYSAAAFKRFYRDNTAAAVVEGLENDIFHGVVETCSGDHRDSLTRADAVMTQAANVQPGGPLAAHARVPVKQGLCHHFANEDLLKWRR